MGRRIEQGPLKFWEATARQVRVVRRSLLDLCELIRPAVSVRETDALSQILDKVDKSKSRLEEEMMRRGVSDDTRIFYGGEHRDDATGVTLVRILFDKSRFCPYFYCAFCGEKIEKVKKGHVLYATDDNGSRNVTVWNHSGHRINGHLFGIHKTCNHVFERANADCAPWAWMPLEEFMLFLRNNSECDWLKPDTQRIPKRCWF